MTRRELAAELAEDLFAAEAAIDEALSRTANLMGHLPRFRIRAGLSAVVGQDAVDRASETVASLAQARRQIVETHHALKDSQIRIRLDGDFGPEDTKGVETPAARIRMVRSGRAA